MKISFAVLASAMLFSVSSSAANNDSNLLVLATPPPAMIPVPDFASFKNVDNKKKAYVAFMKPSVVYLNDAIEKSRARLVALSTSKAPNEINTVNKTDQAFLSAVSSVFNLPLPKTGADETWFTNALKRVDIIPVDLALTQSAKESGWGTSRFAREANNYYGQWCFTAGCGLVPKQRSSGKTYEVASFKDAFESSQAYFVNINTNIDYVTLRDIREKLRNSGKAITGSELANGLLHYSQMGQTYVNEVQSMMRYNRAFWDQTK